MKYLALTIATLVVLASPAWAGRFNKVLSVGDAAPQFAELIGTDDKPHALADFKDAKAVVVVYTCNHCPVAQAYEDRLMAVQKDYQSKGVQVVAINVNNNEADKLEAMKERAGVKNFNYPYLYDASQKSAASYGASVTPHVFVLDGQRKIAYMGAVDDSMSSSDVKQPYLRDALDAVLAGKAPAVTETRQVGCGIQYEKR
jgi:peroxiredoxin